MSKDYLKLCTIIHRMGSKVHRNLVEGGQTLTGQAQDGPGSGHHRMGSRVIRLEHKNLVEGGQTLKGRAQAAGQVLGRGLDALKD